MFLVIITSSQMLHVYVMKFFNTYFKIKFLYFHVAFYACLTIHALAGKWCLKGSHKCQAQKMTRLTLMSLWIMDVSYRAVLAYIVIALEWSVSEVVTQWLSTSPWSLEYQEVPSLKLHTFSLPNLKKICFGVIYCMFFD